MEAFVLAKQERRFAIAVHSSVSGTVFMPSRVSIQLCLDDTRRFVKSRHLSHQKHIR